MSEIRKIAWPFAAPFLILIFLSLSLAQDQITIPDDLSQRLPVDPKIKVAKLDNGLTYYVRVNKKPENRAELRLVIKAGSVLEDEDQQGLAHFAEHMAFNGTAHFEKQELVDYLETIGMRFGPDLNAYTSFDETVYILQVPTDSVHIVETAFQILEDWARAVSFDEDEIEKERGVVIEEWRLRQGAESRMRDRQLPILLKDSRYAERLPIGKKDILETFSPEALRRFYKDWYRPALMAVIAVGDFDPSMIERLIQKHFNKLEPKPDAPPRPVYPVPDHNETLFAIATDPEATRSSVTVYYKHDVAPEGTVGDYRSQLVEILYNNMLNERLQELTKKADPPFLYGFSDKGRFIGSKDAYFLAAGVKDNGIELGLETLLTEAARALHFGFTSTELKRQKKAMLRSIEQAYNERDKTRSGVFASEFIRSFLYDEPIPGIEYEFELFKKFVPEIKLKEVNQLAGTWIRDENRVIMVNSPEKEGVKTQTDMELLAVFDKIDKKEITAYEDKFLDQPLLPSSPSPANIVETREIPSVGVTEWVLGNGVKVVLKPTDFKNDEVLFTSFSPGGHSLVSDDDYISGVTSAMLAREAGYGKFNLIELQKFLTGKVVRVSPYIGELYEGLSGRASPQDLETLFQLIYLSATSPRLDSTAFLSVQSRLIGFLENREARPETAFEDTLQVTLAQYHLRRRPWSEETMSHMDLAKSFEIYRNRFEDAGDFTFLFVGNFELEVVKPLIQTYLGGLPGKNRAEKWRDVGVRSPRGIIKKTVYRGLEDKSQVRFVFTGPFEWNIINRYIIGSMASALRIKLREALREDLGGTYGVGVSASRSQYPEPDYSISISFGCAPDRVAELSKEVLNQIDSLKQYGVDDQVLTKVRESQRRERETSLKQNGFWLNVLDFYYQHGIEPESIWEFDESVEKLSSEDLQKAAKKYFDMDNYVKVVLLPESEKQ